MLRLRLELYMCSKLDGTHSVVVATRSSDIALYVSQAVPIAKQQTAQLITTAYAGMSETNLRRRE